MTAGSASGWVDLTGRRGVALPPASPGPLAVLPEDLRQTVVFVDRESGAREALGGAGLAIGGTPTGGDRGAVVLWGPGLLSCRVEPSRGKAVDNWRVVVHGHTPREFTVATPAGELRGVWTQPGVRSGLTGLFSGWTRSAKAVHVRVGDLALVLRAEGVHGWTITRADGSPSARGNAGTWRVVRDADVLERSVALFSVYAVARSSLLVAGGEV